MNIPTSLDYFLDAFRSYADFDGRSTRAEFWWYTGYCIAFGVVFYLVDKFILGMPLIGRYGPLTITYMLINLVPSVSVSVRRLHDIGKSGWWYLVSWIPLGGLFLASFQLIDSEKGENQWGPNPKGL